jgi:hypothetical protein
MLKGIHPSASDRLWTYSERVGATAALLLMIGFGIGCSRGANMADHENGIL